MDPRDRSRDAETTLVVHERILELEHLYQTAPVGLCLIDRDLRFIRINERLATINGAPIAAHIGRTLRQVYPQVEPRVERIYRGVFETGKPVLDLEMWGSTPAHPDKKLCYLVSHHPLKAEDGTVLAVSTVVQDITRLKETREALEKTDTRLRVLLETTNAIPWQADARTWRFTYVGPQAEKLFGYPLELWLEKDFWTEHIHPEDRDFAINIFAARSGECREYEFEYRMLAADGRIVWVHDIVNVEAKDGKPQNLYGFMIDVSERKQTEQALRVSQEQLRRLAGKLISTQEAERRLLARELHDDLTQRLAVLAIEAGKLECEMKARGVSVVGRIAEMKNQLVRLSTDMHSIARRLHPSILDDLGLISAIESECDGLRQREGISVTYEPVNVPTSLPKDLALCIYRVTQESLSNIAKHARSKRVRVSLRGENDRILLSVEDYGAGFDPAALHGKAGLGLASIEERVRLVQGRLSIRSRPGSGTVIEAEMPLEEKQT